MIEWEKDSLDEFLKFSLSKEGYFSPKTDFTSSVLVSLGIQTSVFPAFIKPVRVFAVSVILFWLAAGIFIFSAYGNLNTVFKVLSKDAG